MSFHSFSHTADIKRQHSPAQVFHNFTRRNNTIALRVLIGCLLACAPVSMASTPGQQVSGGISISSRPAIGIHPGAVVVRLQDDRVLVTGGLADSAGAALARTEIFGIDGSFLSAEPPMILGRTQHA